eukprot:5933046-Pleurochrysis_carterae.AAC.1
MLIVATKQMAAIVDRSDEARKRAREGATQQRSARKRQRENVRESRGSVCVCERERERERFSSLLARNRHEA